VGVGLGCTLRSDGGSIQPSRRDSLRIAGVVTNVATKLAAKTTR
jgi:hypothetical protein